MRLCSECHTSLSGTRLITKTCSAACRSRRSRRLRRPESTLYHCGHPRTAENTYTRPGGRDECRTCKRKHAHKRRPFTNSGACASCGTLLTGRSWRAKYCRDCGAQKAVNLGCCAICGAPLLGLHRNRRLCGAPECRNLRSRLHRFKLSLACYEALRKEQQDSCAICGDKARLEIDHCHRTGHIRGLLCRRCNLMLGHAMDSPEILKRAADYIK